MSYVLELLECLIGPSRNYMHCPICHAVNIIYGPYFQFQCWSCRNWSHVDNWTYTKKAWNIRHPKEIA